MALQRGPKHTTQCLHFKEREAQPGSAGSQVFPVSTRERKTAQLSGQPDKGVFQPTGAGGGSGGKEPPALLV